MQYFLKHLYSHLKVYWLIITVLISSLLLYANWNYTTQRYYDLLANKAHIISENVDDLIENLLQEVYTLPVFDKKKSDCIHTIRPILVRINTNSTKISGIIISTENNELLCSDLTIPEQLLVHPSQPRSINGPFRPPGFEQPIYLITQKIGTLYVSIVILQVLLDEVMNSRIELPETLLLYHQQDKKNLIQINRDQSKARQLDVVNLKNQLPSIQHVLLASDNLQSIPEVIVIAQEKMSRVLYKIWINQMILFIILLCFFYIIYLLINRTLINHYSLRNTLKHALKHNRFFPVYQPIYDHNTQGYRGAEVLLRWNDFNDEIIMPDHFIDEAERTGIIVPITLKIIETAFIETKPILKTSRTFYLSFNITAQHFTETDFFDSFYQLIARYEINPKQIILEITERDLLDKNNHIFLTQMRRLIKAGFSLAIDDYGTGHASISYMQHFPFNYLKIDKIFVQAIGTKAVNESLIDTIITMAKNLNLQIIAEGVETSEQMYYLINNDVRYLQGWYFAKALDLKTLLELLGRGDQDEVN